MTIFIFASTEKVRKLSEQLFSLEENRPTTRIEITINIIVGRALRIVTGVPLQSLRSNYREFGGDIWRILLPLQNDGTTFLRPDTRNRKGLGKRLKLYF